MTLIIICAFLLAIVLTTVAVRQQEEKKLQYWRTRAGTFESLANQVSCVRRIA